ncbi:MAG: GNAT family N-acetyltransferase [Pseudomonadota bacterium]
MTHVRKTDPREPDARALLEASQSLMRALFDPKDNHFLSLDALAAHDVAFFLADQDGQAVGCGALKYCDGYGEIKSMFVTEHARGSGAADALMARLEETARAQKQRALRLETGDTLIAAQRLYARHGFEMRGPFGAYEATERSVFMEKRLF